MNTNAQFQTAKDSKKDEFYTQYIDIEKEISYYSDIFRDKVVYCNCDNPDWSEFWNYFHRNFTRLGLRQLLATYIDEYPYAAIYSGGNDDATAVCVKVPLKGNGDSRSEECIRYLQMADVVVTNPPFSLFRPFLSTLMQYKKQFLIIGNINEITCKEVFPLIQNNEMWLGASIHSGDREFRVPQDYPLTATGFRVDSEGNKYIRVKGVRWFTNIDYDARHHSLELEKEYNSNDYQKYDGYDAINVNKTKDIPKDYDGQMGVPITFIDKYNPDQFKIIGLDRYIYGQDSHADKLFTVNGKLLYRRLIIQKRQ